MTLARLMERITKAAPRLRAGSGESCGSGRRELLCVEQERELLPWANHRSPTRTLAGGRRLRTDLQPPFSQRAIDSSQPTRPLGSAIASGGSEVHAGSEPERASFRQMQPPAGGDPETQRPCQPSIRQLQDGPHFWNA